MRDKLNCPNYGAPIRDTECPYCGSVFYDFATLNSTKPTYIRMRWDDKIITARALMRSATINMKWGGLPTIEIEFMAVPDDDGVTLKQERRNDEDNND